MSPGVINPACSEGFELRSRRQQHSLFPWNSCVVQKHKKCTGSGDLEPRHLTSPRLSLVWKKKIEPDRYLSKEWLIFRSKFASQNSAEWLIFCTGAQPSSWCFWGAGEEPLSLICVWLFLCTVQCFQLLDLFASVLGVFTLAHLPELWGVQGPPRRC